MAVVAAMGPFKREGIAMILFWIVLTVLALLAAILIPRLLKRMGISGPVAQLLPVRYSPQQQCPPDPPTCLEVEKIVEVTTMVAVGAGVVPPGLLK